MLLCTVCDFPMSHETCEMKFFSFSGASIPHTEFNEISLEHTRVEVNIIKAYSSKKNRTMLRIMFRVPVVEKIWDEATANCPYLKTSLPRIHK